MGKAAKIYVRETSREFFLNIENECSVKAKEHREIVTVMVGVRHTIRC